ATLVLIKAENSDLIIGGYNLSGCKVIYDEEFDEEDEYLWTSTDDKCGDLVLNGRNVSCSQRNYEKIFDGNAFFDAEEIEIFN
ncbi:1003_t:CDS:2, partial [Gigaspora rosea]